MAQNPPKAIDVVEIQFKLYTKTKILNTGELIPNNVSLLAVSSARGLLFVGDTEKCELKVFMLSNLIDTENVCNDILARAVPLPGIPNIIVCSCDGSMLAVSLTQNNSSFLQIFNVQSFLTETVNPIHTIKLATEEYIAALQILWNPVIPSNIAIILTNGSLSMFNLKDSGQYEMNSLDKSQQVQCGCWSPKGKQIVLGFPNGKLQQFKPDLTPAKTIPCPAGLHGSNFTTIAVHWLSTFQFVAAFLQDGEGNVPMIYVINAPKGGTPNYINYFDVCYTTGQRFNQINFVHIQAWNLLLVSSANGIEVGLLGCKESGETPTWIQYTLLDDARIEMPLTETKDETYPLGLALDTSCTHQLTYNDKLLPVMPMVHVLSSNGQLLSFNFLNLIPGVPDVCSPPPPISYMEQLFRSLDEHLKPEQQYAPEVVLEQANTPSVPQSGFLSSTPLLKDKNPQFFGNQATNGAQQPIEQMPPTSSTTSFQSGNTAFSGFGSLGGGLPSNVTNIGGMTDKQFLGQLPISDQQQSAQGKPQSHSHPQQLQEPQQQQQTQQQQKPQQSSTTAASGVRSSELNKPLYTIPPTFTPPTSAATNTQQSAQPQKSNSNLSISSKMQSGFLELIQVQISAFDKEIKELAAQSTGLLKNLGNPDEMRGCTKRLHDLQEIIEQANDHEFEMDVQNLRHFLNETRAIIGECRWKLEKYNNPDLPRLGNNMSDAINRRQLAKLQSYLSTNEAQLQALKLQIDAQWSNYQDSTRRYSKSQMHIPCLDGIYQSMTKLQEGLSRHRMKLNQMKQKLQQNGLLYKITNADTSRAYVNVENTIESLSDSILSMTLAPVIDEKRSKLSNEKLKAIRDFTRQHQMVNLIKAQRPNRVGLNSEVVLETMLQSERIKARANVIVAEQKEKKQETSSEYLNKANLLIKPADPSTTSITKTTTTSNANRPFNFSILNANGFMKPTKDEKSPAISFNFQSPSVFDIPSNGISSTEPPTPTHPVAATLEENFPVVPQVPISFAAKVISGTNTLSKSAPLTFSPANDMTTTKTSNIENELKSNESKPFSFTAVGNKNSTNPFGGFGAGESIPATKSQFFDVKNGTGFSGGFNFGGFTSATNNIASTTTTTSATGDSPPPPPPPLMSNATSDGSEATKSANGIFSGFGKSVGTQNNAPPPFGLMPIDSSNSSAPQSLTKSATVSAVSTAPASTLQAPNVTSSTGKPFADLTNSPTTETTQSPTDSLFDSLSVCKPTSKPADSTKTQTSSGNFFAGLGTNSNFSFTGSASNTSFGELTKAITSTGALQITPVTPVTPTAKPRATTTSDSPTTVKDERPVETPTVSSVNITKTTTTTTTTSEPTDFTFSLSSMGTSVIPATTTTATTSSTPTIVSVSSAENVTPKPSTVPSIYSPTDTTATTSSVATVPATNAAVSSAATTFFGTTLFTASATTTTTTTTTTSTGGGIGGSVFGAPIATSVPLDTSFGGFSIGAATTATPTTPPVPGASIFSAAAAASTSPPPSTNIFGGIPKSEQPLFGGTANQSPTSGGNLFSNAAPNASPFGAAGTSAPPNQNVGGSIFSFANSGGSIFGSSAGTSAVSTANAVGSPFAVATTANTATSPGGSIFGASTATTAAATGGSIFGVTTAAKPIDSGSIFSAQQQPAAANSGGGSIFGQSAFGQSGGNTAATGNIFGGGNTVQSSFGSGNSIFAAPSSFSSPSNTTGSTGFGAFSQPNTASPFSSPGAANNAGPFGQGGASVAQSGFGSPQQTSAFNKPIFGGPATFGSPPAFGAQPTFGGAPTFGPQKPFGAFAGASPTSPATGLFGGAGDGAQKNNLFESLGSSDTGLSFGNLAQSASTTGPKPPFGGSSFTSYRS